MSYSMQGTFFFTDDNIAKAQKAIAKYPKGREKSAIMELLHIAQEQNDGWISTEILNYLASFINIAPIRVYEVATFYTMYNLKPIGKYHLQICGTTPCMLRGAEQLVKICEEKLGIKIGETTSDKLFSVSEVECLGGCANAPVVQVNNDYFEDLDIEKFAQILEDLSTGKKVKIGSQIGRKSSEPLGYRDA